ncbi:MAG TPA: hypothetical protein VHZ31_02485 [Solirubrobacteraceae bacterium]|jgi:hypothetical protein|nr:hypothetical protein [Solirubrobacteraceae bacterium]
MSAKPATGPKQRVTPHALLAPLANLGVLTLILVAITRGGIAIAVAAIGLIAWVLARGPLA